MKRLLWLIPILLVSCQTVPLEITKVQDDEQLVMQLAIFKTDYDTDDPKQVLLKHDSVHEFPSSRLIKDDYAKWDIVAADGHYRMEVSYFFESTDGIDLDIAMQRRIKVDEITYGSETDGVTKPIYEKERLETARFYHKDKWYILGGNYNKPRGEKNGSGVYFLLRVNSRLSYDLDLSKVPSAKVVRENENRQNKSE
jgi:hypothetical protein